MKASNKIKLKTIFFYLFLSVITITSLAQAGDRLGNGGSGDEAQMAAQQAQLETIALKIKYFFDINKKSLRLVFTEFTSVELINTIENSKIIIVDHELIDKNGINRTCLNYPETNLIECKFSEIDKTINKPQALFVLIFHEILGLLRVEETSPTNPQLIDGYSISKRIAGYVTKVNDYDLIFEVQSSLPIKTKKLYQGIINTTGEKCSLVLTTETRALEKGLFHYANISKEDKSIDGQFYLGRNLSEIIEDDSIINNRSEICLEFGICMFDLKNQVLKINFKDLIPTSFLYSTEKAENSYTRKPILNCDHLSFIKEKNVKEEWTAIKK
jgi:hypothetical protein